MSFSNTAETAINTHIFVGTALPWAANTDLWLALHTADPGEAGTAATSEAAYGSYARQAIARSGAGWTVTANEAKNAALIQFPECSSGSETITHVSITTAVSGTSKILYSGALSASRSVSSGIQPQFAAAALTVTED